MSVPDFPRISHPKAAFDFIVETYHLSEEVRALDLGCGPGTIAIPLSHAVSEVVAVDPDADMVAEGRHLAASRGRQNIQWLQSRAEDISPEAGPFRVSTMGRLFTGWIVTRCSGNSRSSEPMAEDWRW